ncbi:MAG: FtsQ-type POTRA domain-containing protein [Pseudomonadota bacterium]
MRPLIQNALIHDLQHQAYRWSRRLHPLAATLGRVRYPNGLLASLVVMPSLVMGFTLSDRTADGREAVALSISSAAAKSGFGVRSVRISGLGDTREGDVLDYLSVGPETSVVGFDMMAARERVLALPWVRDASVRRVYPDTLLVDIEEHAPFARMLRQGRIFLVTLDGTEITDEVTGAHASLPLVVGEGAPEEASAFFTQLAERPYVLDRVVALERVGERRWTLHMHANVRVFMPETQADIALLRLEGLMREDALLERAVAVVDLRQADQLVVRLVDGAAELMGPQADAFASSGVPVTAQGVAQ